MPQRLPPPSTTRVPKQQPFYRFRGDIYQKEFTVEGTLMTTTMPTTSTIDAATKALPSPWRELLREWIDILDYRRQLAANEPQPERETP